MYCRKFYFLLQLYSWKDGGSETIRPSIFLTTGVCAGFPALLWALAVLYRHHKSGGRISFIAIFLLLSDLLELILNPVAVSYIFREKYLNNCTVLNTLFGARLSGHLLHQLVASESILRQKYPSLAVVFSASCSIILCIFVLVVTVGTQFIESHFITIINMCLCVLPVIVCAFTCVVTCKATPDTSQATDRKPGMLVLSVALFTLFISYVPFFLTYTLPFPLMLDFLTNMRLILEPLLCVLTCRENRLAQ